MYHYYEGTRIPNPNGRECNREAYSTPEIRKQGTIDLEDFIQYSSTAADAATKEFRLTLFAAGQEITSDLEPPGWITSGKALSLR